jgi:hypothetical protein
MSVPEIAARYQVGTGTIQRWLRRTGIVRDDIIEVRDDGSGRTRVFADGHAVAVHRLVAYAEHGDDVFEADSVHHGIPVPWVNIPEYLFPMSKETHNRTHAREIQQEDGYPVYFPVKSGSVSPDDGEIPVPDETETA